MRRTYPKSDHPDKYLLKPSTRPADELRSPLILMLELCARTGRGVDSMIDALLRDVSNGSFPGAIECSDNGKIYELPIPLSDDKMTELRQQIADAWNAGAWDVPIAVDDTYGYLLLCCCAIDDVYPWQYEEDRRLYLKDQPAEKPSNAKPESNSEAAESEESEEIISLKYDMILNVVDRDPLKRSIKSADAEKLVRKNWGSELEKRGLTIQAFPVPGRSAIERALGRRE